MNASIIGGGAWGTALATVVHRAGHRATLWAREDAVVDGINARHRNDLFLPGVLLPPALRATTDLADAVRDADAIFLVPPAQHLRELAGAIAPAAPRCPVVICAKGIELSTGALLSDVVAQELPGAPVAVLSGPTFAAEVAEGLPTAVTVASLDSAACARVVDLVGSTSFRPYRSADPVGAQIGGAVKNVLAIACGVVTGLGLGENARAALVTRGLAETVRLGRALGARTETLMGLSGLGDLSLTCNSPTSRNMSFGIELARGRAAADILAGRQSVTEGVDSAPAVVALAGRHGVDVPICQAVSDVLQGTVTLEAAMASLLARELKPEHDLE